jgi:HEAT repeat protein
MTMENATAINLLQSGSEEERLLALRSLDKSHSDSPRWFLLILGDESWRVRKEATELFLALPHAPCLVGEVIELLHSEDNAGLRNAAVEILMRIGSPALPFLVEELSCNDHDVRKFALDILGAIGDPSCFAAMQKALHDDDANVRAAAAENLGRLRVAEAIPALLQAMEQPDLLLRFAILEAFARIGASLPLAPLLPFYGDPLLRKSLLDCLGHLADEEAIPLLVDALGDDLRNTREAAAVALLRLNQRFPGVIAPLLRGLISSATIDKISLLLDSSDKMVRRFAFQLLSWLELWQQAPRLLPFLASEEDREEVARVLVALTGCNPEPLLVAWAQADTLTQTCLAYVFGEAGSTAALPLLIAALENPDSELAAVAAQALGRLEASTAIAPLARCLESTSEDLQQASRSALVRLARSLPAEVSQHVRPILDGGQASARVTAVQVIGSLPGVQGLEILGLAMKDEAAPVRGAAIRAFGSRFAAADISPVVLALTDEDAEVRRVAAEVLGDCSDPKAISPLALTLLDQDLWVRAAAVRALGRLPGGTQQISTALKDPVGLVRIAALESFCEADREEAIPALLEALDCPDEEVVKASARLLAACGRGHWLSLQGRRLLDHRHREVRMTVARLLAEGNVVQNIVLLENRLPFEGDELVRGQLVELLAFLRQKG